MTPSEHGGPTDDEIDTLLRDAVGEIDEQRFDTLVARAVQPVGESEGSAAPPGAARTRRWAGSGTIGGQLLAAAAVLVVVAVGFGALASRNNDGGTATEAAGPVSTTTAAGPEAPAATVPGSTAVDEVASCERNETDRNFICRVPAAARGAQSVELFDDESLTEGVVVEPGRLACVEVVNPDRLTVVGGDCTGAGLSITAPASGTYTIQYEVRSCEIGNDGTADRPSCVAATSVVEGEILVLVGV
jgi:hypothetical protein